MSQKIGKGHRYLMSSLATITASSDYRIIPIPTLFLPLKGREFAGASPFKGEVGRGMGEQINTRHANVTK
jgi:hypothetical protein